MNPLLNHSRHDAFATAALLVALLAMIGAPSVAADPALPPSPWTTGQYSYDASGNIKAIGADRYTYDAVGRLKSGSIHRGAADATATRTQRYDYDGFGNMKAIAVDGVQRPVFSVESATNRLAAAHATYDLAGNQTSENGGPLWTFDAFNSMTVGPNGTQYIYDANDERIAIGGVNANDWRWTVRDLGARAVREFTETASAGGTVTWTWSRDYVYRGSSLLGSYVNEGGTTKRLHYHLDHLGTPRLTTEATAGTAIARAAVTDFPFGEEPTVATAATETRRFTGHERDYHGGLAAPNGAYLDYMHARFYNPVKGRFLSVDPYLNLKTTMYKPQQWNRYAYVENNPINMTDPTGEVGVKGIFKWIDDKWHSIWPSKPNNDHDRQVVQLANDVGMSQAEAQSLQRANVREGLQQGVSTVGSALTQAVVAAVLYKGVDKLGQAVSIQLNVSTHASERMIERGISLGRVQQTVNVGERFKYFHDGAWKVGFYDPKTKTFVGAASRTITTVIDGVTRSYIDNLKKAVP